MCFQHGFAHLASAQSKAQATGVLNYFFLFLIVNKYTLNKYKLLIIIFLCIIDKIYCQKRQFPEGYTFIRNGAEKPLIPFIDSLTQTYAKYNIQQIKTDTSDFIFEKPQYIKSISFRYPVDNIESGNNKYSQIKITYKNNKIISINTYDWDKNTKSPGLLRSTKNYFYNKEELGKTDFKVYGVSSKVLLENYSHYIKLSDTIYECKVTEFDYNFSSKISKSSNRSIVWKYIPKINEFKPIKVIKKDNDELAALNTRVYNWDYDSIGKIKSFSVADSSVKIPLFKIEFSKTGKIKKLISSTKETNYNYFSNEYIYTEFDSINQIICKSFSDSITTYKRLFDYDENKKLKSVFDFYNYNSFNKNMLTMLKPYFFETNVIENRNNSIQDRTQEEQYVCINNQILSVNEVNLSKRIWNHFSTELKKDSNDYLQNLMVDYLSSIDSLSKTKDKALSTPIKEIDTIYYRTYNKDYRIEVVLRQENDKFRIHSNDDFDIEKLSQYVYWPSKVKTNSTFGLKTINFKYSSKKYSIKQYNENGYLTKHTSSATGLNELWYINIIRLNGYIIIKDYYHPKLNQKVRTNLFTLTKKTMDTLIFNDDIYELRNDITLDDKRKPIEIVSYDNLKSTVQNKQIGKTKRVSTITKFSSLPLKENASLWNENDDLVQPKYFNSFMKDYFAYKQLAYSYKNDKTDSLIARELIFKTDTSCSIYERPSDKLKTIINYKYIPGKANETSKIVFSTIDSMIQSYNAKKHNIFRNSQTISDTIIQNGTDKNKTFVSIKYNYTSDEKHYIVKINKSEELYLKSKLTTPHISFNNIDSSSWHSKYVSDSISISPIDKRILYRKTINSDNVFGQQQNKISIVEEKYIYDKNGFLLSLIILENGKEIIHKTLVEKIIYFN